MVNKKEQEIKKTEKTIENIEESLTRSEEFIIKNQNSLIIGVVVVLVIVLGYFGYQKYIIEPKTQDAQEQIFSAQQFFEADSLDKALFGDGNHLGFVDIADEYSSTKPGKLANYYAGICFLKKGDYDKAIDYLSKFKADDELVAPMAQGAIGDAYLEKGDQEKAVSQYLKAASMKDNSFTSSLFYFKAAQTLELMGKNEDALVNYTIIRDKFPTTKYGSNIDRYIARVEAKLGK
jgi:predicted negative regulator of RcsB-dependent stress response